MQNGLQILRWSFWSPETRFPDEWLEAPRALPGLPADLGGAIPAAHRRRMSTLSKMALHVALDVSSETRPDVIVFCSQHGELARTRELLRSIVDGVELSPASFSQSVHNTAAGLYTIVQASRAPATSIAAGAASFAYGWLEAEAVIAEHPAHQVLLVCYDEPLAEEYRVYEEHDQRLYALALVLGAGIPGLGIELELGAPANAEELRPLAPVFMAWALGAHATFEVTAGGQGFRFSRNAAQAARGSARQ